MGRKKKHEEHENLERWLVSYADFMTLLFATFVVLYALSQVDVAKFTKLGESLHGAFSNSVLQGSESIMDQSGDNVIATSSGESMMDSLIFEYLNPKYEQSSFDDIEKEVNQMKKDKSLDGVDVREDDRGLVITMSNKALEFAPGSADLSTKAKVRLDKIGVIIGKRFIVHNIRVEGHTDNVPFTSAKYPSNWELSSARACSVVRYLQSRFKFDSGLFTAVGYADTRPKASNSTEFFRAKNRTVDIVILKNKYRTFEDSRDTLIKLDRKQQKAKRAQQIETINQVMSLSDAAKELTGNDEGENESVIKLDKKH